MMRFHCLCGALMAFGAIAVRDVSVALSVQNDSNDIGRTVCANADQDPEIGYTTSNGAQGKLIFTAPAGQKWSEKIQQLDCGWATLCDRDGTARGARGTLSGTASHRGTYGGCKDSLLCRAAYGWTWTVQSVPCTWTPPNCAAGTFRVEGQSESVTLSEAMAPGQETEVPCSTQGSWKAQCDPAWGGHMIKMAPSGRGDCAAEESSGCAPVKSFSFKPAALPKGGPVAVATPSLATGEAASIDCPHVKQSDGYEIKGGRVNVKCVGGALQHVSDDCK